MLVRIPKVLGVLALTGAAVGALAVENRIHGATHRPLPQTHGAITVAGLQRNVEVVRDAWGAPHIHAKTDADAFFALGYVSAQERLFQMDLVRRLATGRLAEVVGPGGIKADKIARVVGFARMAEDIEPLLSGETRRLSEAYVAGVNAYMADAPLPVEFGALGYAPEPWTIRDSLAIGRFQSAQLSFDWANELTRMAIVAERGADLADLLMPGLETWGPYILNPEQRDYTGSVPTVGAAAPEEDLAFGPELGHVATQLLAAVHAAPRGMPSGVASNNWVVAGSKTASGKPLLANDPHLSMPMPSVWMEVTIKSPSFQLTGVMFPGLPVIPLGHNRYIAWGATTTVADTQDLYIERPHPTDPWALYETPGGVRRYRIDMEQIIVKGGGPGGSNQHIELPVRISRHGPVINDLAEGLPADTPPIALRWAAAEPTDDVTGFFAVARATGWAEFKAGIDQIGAPIQNWVFAGIDGDIGYICGGLIPVRAPGHDPRAPVAGHTDDHEWVGWIPRDELPQVLNPPAGYIASANNKVVPPAYPYYVQNSSVTPYRAARIQELLADATDLTRQDMERMHMDDYMVVGRRLTPHLVRAVNASGTDTATEAAALAALAEWDYHASLDSVGATVFHAAVMALFEDVVADEVSPEVYAELSSMFGMLRGMGLLDRMCNEGFAAPLWDDRRTDAIETPDVILAGAFQTGVAEMAEHLGSDVASWQWGRVHQQHFSHPFSGVAPGESLAMRDAKIRDTEGMIATLKSYPTRLRNAVVDDYFGAGPFPLAGTSNTVRASPFVYAEGRFDAQWGVSWRHIVDMADVSTAVSVITTGNSGHAASEHYRDQVELWLTGQYHPMPIDLGAEERTGANTLTLMPAASEGAS